MRHRPKSSIVVMLLVISVLAGTRSLEANYAEVYQNTEAMGWTLLSPSGPENQAAYCSVLDAVHGEDGISDCLIEVAAHVGTNDSKNPGRFTILVTPLSDNIEVIQKTEGLYSFRLDGMHQIASWCFTYRVENISPEESMGIAWVRDSFGAELKVKDWAVTCPSGVDPGVVEFHTNKGKMEKWFFNWDGFKLGPSQWAELSVVVETGLNPAGKQEYTSCGIHDLNSEGTLKYATDGKPGFSERKGYTFQVEVPCASYLCLDFLGAKITWFIRKPGDCYVQAVKGAVTASGPVRVTFDGFGNLMGTSTGDIVPVFYALGGSVPDAGSWMDPDQLNLMEQYLECSDSTVEWVLWQRVLLGTQSVDIYHDKGVVTFTLGNTQTSFDK